MTTNADDRDHVLEALHQRIPEFVEDSCLVVSYVVIASFMGADGERHVYCDMMEGQRAHESLGLLDFAQSHERGKVYAQAAKDFGEPDDS